MALDPSIILQGRAPDIIGALDAGTMAGMRSNAAQQENALRGLYSEQGANILAGQPGALNALAGLDPAAAMNVQQGQLGMQQTRQNMAFDAESMQMKRQAAKEAAAAGAAQLSAQQRAEGAAKIESGLTAAGMAYKSGNREAYNAVLAQSGIDPATMPFDQFPMFAAQYSGVLDALKDADAVFAAPDPTKGAPSGYMFNDPRNPAGGVSPLPGYEKTPAVQVNMGENTGAFVKKADEEAATRFSEIAAAGQNAQALMGDVQALSAIAGRVNTGKGAEITAALGPYAQALGVEVDGLSDLQTFNAIRDRLVPMMRTPGSGATSDFDARMFLNSLPSLATTPEGNSMIADTLAAVQQHKMASAAIANQAFTGAITWQDAEKKIADLGNPYDTFNASRDRISTGNPTAPRQTQPVQVIDGFTIEGLD